MPPSATTVIKASIKVLTMSKCIEGVTSVPCKGNNQVHILELYKIDLNDPDNHNGVITHLETNILECEVKWVLGSITAKKLVEVMEFHLRYFKS